MKTILLIGNCGVGKTYVMQSLIVKLRCNMKEKLGLINMHSNNKVAILGKYSGNTFDGSDQLSMAVSKDFDKLKAWATASDITLVCEGDRFTNSFFVSTFNPEIILIEGSGKEGRIKRKSNQSDRQIQSIATRISKYTPNKAFLNSKDCLDYLCEHLN